MASVNFRKCIEEIINRNFASRAINYNFMQNIDEANPSKILNSIKLSKPQAFDSLGNIQQCLPIPNEIKAFTGANKRSATPKSIISEKYKTVFDVTQYTTKFFSSGSSTLADNLKADLCNLLNDKGFCNAHPDWSAAGILLCMIDAREGTTFADVPSGRCEYNTVCHSSHFSNFINKDGDGSNSLAMQVAFELCDLF